MSNNTYVASNNANSTLAGNLTATSTSFTVYTGQGSRFPTINDGGVGTQYTKATFQKSNGTKEIVTVVRHDAGTDAFTIGVAGAVVGDVAGRAQEGTSAASWSIGDVVAIRPTKGLIETAVQLAENLAVSALAALTSAADKVAYYTAEGAAALADLTAFGRSLIAAADAAAVRALLVVRGSADDVTLAAGKVIVFEGTTDDAHELTVSGGEPTADRTQTHQDASGTLALIGVEEVIGCFPAAAMKARTTNACGTLAWDESATNKVMTGYLAFDAAAIEYAQFSFRAPNSLDESTGFKALFVWKEAGAAAAHDCVWQIEMQAQGDADTLDSAWGTAVTVTDTGAASKRYISSKTAAITPGGTWAAGDEILVQVSRKATDGADTLDVDAHLIEVVLIATYAASAEA